MPRDDDKIHIERLGGFAGFGGANLKSEGSVDLDKLAEGERDAVKRLFARKGQSHSLVSGGDMFRYRLVWRGPGGKREIELGEDEVPESLRSAVKDTLR